MFKVGVCCKVRYLLFSFYSTSPEEMSWFWRYIHSAKMDEAVPEDWRYSTPSVRLNPQTSLIICLAWLILTAKKKNRPDGALDRNTAQLIIGTAMHSGSEHRKAGRAFSYPSNATSEYFQTVIVHHITREIFNSIMIITKIHQVIALSCRFWRKWNLTCKRPKSKMKMLIVRYTRNQMSYNLHRRTRESFPVPSMLIC